jgi:signal transduction histidine kinase
MTDETVERKTLLGFVAALGILVLVSAIAMLSFRAYGRSTQWVTHSHRVISELEAVSAALSAAEAGRLGYLATGESFYLQERDTAVAKLQDHLQATKRLTADNASQQRRLSDLQGRLTRRSAEVDGLIARVQNEGLQAGQRGLKERNIRQATLAANEAIGAAEADERVLLVSRQDADDFWAGVLIAACAALLVAVSAILGWLCWRIRQEMAERKLQSAALDRANAGLASANRELESFSYSVSHDLRSPLRAIDGYSQMLEEDYGKHLDDTGRRYIRTVRGGSQRMAALIDDLLTFSRLSRQSLNRQTVDMTALARRAAAEVLDGRPDPKPAVRIDELPPVPGDPALLRQVWTNLISNAVKYSSKAPTPQVEVRATREGDLVRYEIQDNGVGFDMRYADKLFGVFQRLHSLEEYPGTGVGLAIVQRIVNRHQGAVMAQGERGKGATFGFTLPTEV